MAFQRFFHFTVANQREGINFTLGYVSHFANKARLYGLGKRKLNEKIILPIFVDKKEEKQFGLLFQH